MFSIIQFSLFVGTTLFVLLGQGYSHPINDLYGAPGAYYYPADVGMSSYDNYDYTPAAGISNYDFYNYPAAGMAIYNHYDDKTASMLDDNGFENQSTAAVNPPSSIMGRSDGLYPNQRPKRQWVVNLFKRYGPRIYRWGERVATAYNIGEIANREYNRLHGWWNSW